MGLTKAFLKLFPKYLVDYLSRLSRPKCVLHRPNGDTDSISISFVDMKVKVFKVYPFNV